MKDSNDLDEPLNPRLEEQSLSEETCKFLRTLEGDCRVSSHTFLKISYLKIMMLGLPCALTLVGLALLYRLTSLRVLLLFDKISASERHSATHVFIRSSNKTTTVSRIKRKHWKGRTIPTFCFQELQYQIHEERVLPLGMKVKEGISSYMDPDFLSTGLSQEQALIRLQFYGKNEHLVEIPRYFEFIFDLFFLQPFIYMQYIYLIVLQLLQMPLYAFVIILTNLITGTINYLFIRFSHLKIKGLAEKQYEVEVLRQGVWRKIQSSLLVPGDLYRPNQYIICDSIVVKENLFVNQVSFTGETTPIAKFAISEQRAAYDNLHWIHEGSQIVSKKANCLALAINTGYSTRKGRVIRKILNPKKEDNQVFKGSLKFSLIIMTLNLCLYFLLFDYMFSGTPAGTKIKILIFALVVMQGLPASVAAFVNMAYTVLLIRLRLQNIVGLNGTKTIESSRIQLICFDKTGTLTQNQMEIKEILIHNRIGKMLQRALLTELNQQSVLHRLFACCHTVQEQNGKLYGDQIDLRMFQAANVLLIYDHLAEGVVFQVKQIDKQQGLCMQILKVYQFESKFQSMSVIARDKETKQTFIFVKGSPQKLHNLSIDQVPNFAQIMRKLSLQGFRSIAVSAKQIQGSDWEKYDRQQCLLDTSLLAIVTFANSLKPDAASSLSTLRSASIKTKMITGDNIYVGIQTALSLEMVPSGSRIIALEGTCLLADGGLTAIAVHKNGSTIMEEQIDIPQLSIRFFQGQYLAMDFDFIKKRQDIFLQTSPILFARATPETKAVIIKKEKQKIRVKYKQRSLWNRIFGGRIHKVGMVGDGANDLMAIRQADVGIGMSKSDAVLSSDFTITSLSAVETILRQGRAGETKVAEIASFSQMTSLIINALTFLIINDMALIEAAPGIIKNVCLAYIAPIALAYTPPTEALTPYFPSFNFVGLQFSLIWWGTASIVTAGMTVSITYYHNSPDFTPNPNPTRINGCNKSATIAFLANFMITLVAYLALVGSAPFKKRFYHNPLLLGQLIITFIIATLQFEFTQHLHFLTFEPIAFQQVAIVYGICIVTGIIANLYAWLIRSMKLYERQDQKQESGFVRLKELTHSI